MSTAYIVGGGLAGLSAAVALAQKGRKVVLIEGAPQAGGRCRSYFDATLGTVIDNGNHLVLSGNHSVQTYLAAIGATDALAGPDRAVFDFVDVRSELRWTLRPNDSLLAWWIFDATRRVPGTAAARLSRPGRSCCLPTATSASKTSFAATAHCGTGCCSPSCSPC